MFEHAVLPAEDAALIEALQSANLPTLLLVLVHLTGDPQWMRGDYRPQRASPQRPDGGFSPQQSAELRERAIAVLREFRDVRGGRLPALPSLELFQEMMSFSLGQKVPPEYAPMMREDMLWDAQATPQLGASGRDFHVVVIGAGMSGLLAAVKLAQAGVHFTVIEKNPEVGGTWFENSYPGCRVDLPSHFYSYSFEPNHDWSEHFSRRDELLAYFRRIAMRYGVRERIRFGCEVQAAQYDPASAAGPWSVQLRAADGSKKTLRAHALISAVGQLNRPAIPQFPGLPDFAGAAFHTADFRHDVPLDGKRVAVVGSGASAMQVVPPLAAEAEQLVIFQRSPQWAISVPNYFERVSAGKRWLLRHLPYYAQWYRFRLFYSAADGLLPGLRIDPNWPHSDSINASNQHVRGTLTQYIESELEGRPDLLAKSLPDYPPFAKRMLLDNNWFKTLRRPNVELVTEAIEQVTPRGIRVQGGAHYDLDAIVFATGFQANRFLWPMDIRGAHGRSLHEQWGDDPRAYLGITVPNFPNLFCLYGPNTNLAHGGSIIFHSECQMHYIMGCLQLLFEGGHNALDCKQEAHDAYNARVDAAHSELVWSLPHVSNWFRNSAGRVTTNSPFRLVDYWAMTRNPDPADYLFT